MRRSHGADTTFCMWLVIAVVLVVQHDHQLTATGFSFPTLSTTQRRTTHRTLLPFTTITSTTTTQLWAKKRTKTKPNKAGGGFGTAPSPAPAAAAKSKKKKKKQAPSKKMVDPNDDYAVFPRLEPQVLKTLIPAHPEDATIPGDLPPSLYERLDQIYGMSNFNYENQQQASLSDLLMAAPTASSDDSNDLLSSSSSSSSPLDNLMSSTPSLGSSELDSLLASATGSTAPPPTPKTAAVDTMEPLPLESIAPFSQFRVLHVDPLVLAIDDFFTEEECDAYVSMSSSSSDDDDDSSSKFDILTSRSPTVGKDSAAKAQRTSTTYYHHFHAVPELMAKASRLLGLETIGRWEEPQTVRYQRGEKFTWHLDALGPTENKADLGGQRLATLLVYLTDLEVEEGGATLFRDLRCGTEDDAPSSTADDVPLRVQPRKGTAVLFFPAAGGIPDTPFDIRTLHSGQAVSTNASHDKWIAQLWLREGAYTPTAPPGNKHEEARESITKYCESF